MIYNRLLKIRSAIEAEKLYDYRRIYLGERYNLGADSDDLIIIKSGPATLDNSGGTFTVHLMSKLYDKSNVEQKQFDYVERIVKILRLYDRQAKPSFLTTDADVFLPINAEFTPQPPFGGFRLDLELFEPY